MVIYMKVRLGYACISTTLDNITPSTPYTYTEYSEKHNLDKLDNVIKSNLEDLIKILKYNVKNNIHFFRLSSKLVPLATRSDVVFDYHEPYIKYYDEIAKIIKDTNMRVDFHPDQFCILNSTRLEVINNTFEILKYHYNLLNYFNVNDKILVLHVGSSVFGKDNSKVRFINNFNLLPESIKGSIVIENDDKVFTLKDCIDIYNVIKIPIVLDYHHFICNNDDSDILNLLKTVFESWNDKTPKMHFSSPKNKTKKDFRSHHDYINSDDFIKFLKILKVFDKDVDIMIEAKQKDQALFKLVRELKYKTNYRFIDETTFIV